MDDLVILVDSREQAPYGFERWNAQTMTHGLPTGDYSAKGYEEIASVERKTLDDFVGSVTFGRGRFLREVERLAALPVRAVVVEANVDDVYRHRYQSRASPKSVLGSALAIVADYAVPLWWAGSRDQGEAATYWLLRRAAEKHAPIERGAA